MPIKRKLDNASRTNSKDPKLEYRECDQQLGKFSRKKRDAVALVSIILKSLWEDVLTPDDIELMFGIPSGKMHELIQSVPGKSGKIVRFKLMVPVRKQSSKRRKAFRYRHSHAGSRNRRGRPKTQNPTPESPTVTRRI